jgi:hypothetical protein
LREKIEKKQRVADEWTIKWSPQYSKQASNAGIRKRRSQGWDRQNNKEQQLPQIKREH